MAEVVSQEDLGHAQDRCNDSCNRVADLQRQDYLLDGAVLALTPP